MNVVQKLVDSVLEGKFRIIQNEEWVGCALSCVECALWDSDSNNPSCLKTNENTKKAYSILKEEYEEMFV